MKTEFNTIPDAINALRKGEIVILVDDEARENEGDLVLASEKATKEKINFMIKDGRGLMCLPITAEKARQFSLKRMTPNTDKFETPFTVSIDAKTVSTGVSVEDRLKTIKVLGSKNCNPNNLSQPGHMFPLIAKEGGVLERAGHTEGAIDLLLLAKLEPVAVIVEIMNQDGSMARLDDLALFRKRHRLKMVCLRDLIGYRLKSSSLVKKVASPLLPTIFGTFRAIGYQDLVHNREYIALVKGKVKGAKNVLVRVHSGCITGDIFHSLRCDCNKQLQESFKMIERNGRGVILYLPYQEGRGIGLMNKLKAYELQEKGLDTVEANEQLGFEADLREYGIGAQILRDLGLTSIKLITNNPKKLVALKGYGLKITGRMPIKTKTNKYNLDYIRAKKEKLGHLI